MENDNNRSRIQYMNNQADRFEQSSVQDYNDARARIEAQVRANAQARLNAQANTRPVIKRTESTDDIDELLASLNLNDNNTEYQDVSQTQVMSRRQFQSAMSDEIDTDSALQSSPRVRNINSDSALRSNSRVRSVNSDSALQSSPRVRSVNSDSALQGSSRVRSVNSDVPNATVVRRNNQVNPNQNRSDRVAPSLRQNSSSGRVSSVASGNIDETVVIRRNPERSQRVPAPETVSDSGRRNTAARTSSSPQRRSTSGRITDSDDDYKIVTRPKKEVGYSRTRVNSNVAEAATARRARQANENGGRTVKQPVIPEKKGKFGKFLIIYAIIWIVIIIVGAIIFRSFLAKSESYQPIHIIEAITEKFSSAGKLTPFLNEFSSIVIRPDGVESDDNFVESVAGKQISFIEDSGKSTTNSVAYKLKADGNTIASAIIAMNGKGDFGLDKWGLASLDITEGFPDLIAYNILVPDGAVVSVNGQTLDANKITATGVPEVLQNSVQYLSNPPQMVTYTTKMLPDITPEVSGTNAAGNPLSFTSSETGFVAVPNASQEFVDSVYPLVDAAIREWGTYFIHMSFNLEPYILEGCDLYKYIFGSEDMDPILTWLYNFEYIVDYEFTEVSASNFIVYSDECFTVDVKYNLAITFDREGVEDNNQNLDATWVFVRDGDSWSICDMIYH